ncbi:MAG: alpha/beta hydrolase [Planctomycetaceae bacterium]|nr:alpha/beta hydrolase [Planctomycetaceae bacterium]
MKVVNVGGMEMWYEERGRGLPLVLVHGFPLDHTMWSEQMAPLADSNVGGGLRPIAPDLPGFGRSPASRDVATMEQFADDLAAALDALRIAEPVVVCGLSMGGYIALQFWRKHAARLRALILCDTRATADAPAVAASRLTDADRVLREGPGPLVESMLPRVFGATTHRERPHLVENVRGVMMANPPRGIAAAARGMAERPDMSTAAAEIRCPTLVIVGAEDTASTPAEVRRMAQSIPNAEFVEIPAAGHLCPLENPVAVNAAMMAFIAKHTK